MKFFACGLVVLSTVFAGVVCASEKTHLEAAEKYIKLIEADRLMTTVMQQIIRMQIQEEAKREPCLRPYENAQREISSYFANQIIDLDDFKKKLAALYIETFTEEEINQIIAFFNTPTGLKMREKMPMLAQKGAELGQQLVQEGMKKTESKEFKEKFDRFKEETYKKMVEPSTVTPECKQWFEENVQGKKPAAKKNDTPSKP